MKMNQSKTVSAATRSALSPQELADRWGRSRQTIHNMIRDGELRSFKVRDSRLIPLAEIERIERG
jgi:excisionase family DNA binding protein